MAQLKYKTRGMTNPKGKPRVYFCCHPEDHARYFDEISDMLLEKQNCAIWYLDDGGEMTEEELFGDLRQMQLFVMPVTEKLLYSSNRALDVEFKFAVENRIPILPLMQESGLEDAFNQKCGDIQFLDKNIKDATAISFDEKLEKFLAAVLIGDELAEKIRAAFDAYVFLSYRKKDRKYAQELMKLIHKKPFCRDIAIWYDEFLTPGENFNDSIRDALQKSGLFVLTVTPNLVNEENYIMTTEYPMAKAEGKPILPAELVPTDKGLLTSKYDGIPQCTDAHNDGELTGALLDAITKMAIKENDQSPEHNFFIGLAYLGGVDVEVDHERALELITSAAEAGLQAAVTKLIEMYDNGIGVKRSYETAAKWREKKAQLMRAEYEAEPSENGLNDLFWQVVECGDAYRDLGQPEVAVKHHNIARELVEKSGFLEGSRRLKRDLTVSYNRLGNIYKNEGRLALAKDCYRKSLDARVAITSEGDSDSMNDLTICYMNLGNISKEEGKLAEAEEMYQKALQIREALVKKSPTVFRRESVSTAYTALGNVAQDKGDLDTAWEYHYKAFCIDRDIAAELNTNDAMVSLAISHNKLGKIHQARGDLAKAKEEFIEAAKLRMEAAEKTDTMNAWAGLSMCYINIGDICTDMGDLNGAEKYYYNALEIRREQAQKYKNLAVRERLGLICSRLGNLYKNKGDLERSLEFYGKDLEITKKIAEETGTVAARRSLAVSYSKLATVYKNEGKLTKALEMLMKSYEIDEALANETGMVTDRCNLSVSCQKLGDIFKQNGDTGKAKEYYVKDYELSLKLAQETGTVKSRGDLSISLNKLGALVESQGELEEALEYYRKAYDIRLALVKETNTVDARRKLAISYENIGDVMKAQGKLHEALEYYEKELAIDLQLVDEIGTVEARTDLSIDYNKIGAIYKSQKEYEKARDYYLKSLELREALAKETGTVAARRNLSTSYNNLGNVYSQLGGSETARKYYELDLELSIALAEESEQISDRRNLAISYRTLGNLCKDNKEYAEACDFYIKGAETRAAVSHRLNSTKDYWIIAENYRDAGTCREELDDIEGAVKLNLEALKWREKALGKIESEDSLRKVSFSLSRLGRLYKKLGDYPKAREVYTRDLEISKQLAEKSFTPQNRESLAISYQTYSTVAGDAKKEYLSKALELMTALCAEYPDNEGYQKRRDNYTKWLNQA